MGLDLKTECYEKAGMVIRVLEDLFASIHNPGENLNVTESTISISFIEIYNEKVYDLLSESQDSIFTKGSKFPGSTKKTIASREDAVAILSEANKNRHVRSTILNSYSSRSHAIFTIFAELKTLTGETSSALNLVDLAGSEGLKKTGHFGIAAQEGILINQGLLAIQKVLQALSSGNKLIPYRDSTLSTVLQGEICVN